MSNTTVTAADVRAYFRTNDKALASLDAADAKTVAEGARGRLSPKAIARFNKGRRPNRRYALGNSGVVKSETRAQRQALIDAGLAGKRGPLSKAAKASLSTPKA